MIQNVGGILNIWAFQPSQIAISMLPDVPGGCNVAISNVSMDDALIRCTDQSIDAVSKYSDDDNGGLWKLSVDATVGGINLSHRKTLDLIRRKCVLVLQNTNNDFFVFGSPDSPLSPIEIDRVNPPAIANNTKYQFSLAGFAVVEPPIIQHFL